MTTRQQWIDLGERTVWTLLQAGIGVTAIETLHLPALLGVVLAGALSALKSGLAQQWGTGTGATVPADAEPRWF